MILLDFSPIIIANGCTQYAKTRAIDTNLLRHSTLNSLRFYNKKFRSQFGELVLCMDSSHYWRKEKFEYYKGQRKGAQAKSNMDWDSLFKSMNIVKKECMEHLPFRSIMVHGTEADDVIATVALNTSGKHVIISGDKDFTQLLENDNIRLFSSKAKKFVSCKNPKAFLLEQIVRGDASDGIPNIKSDPDTFANASKRQSQIRNDFMATLLQAENPKQWMGEFERTRFEENELLIDLTKTPKDLQVMILEQLNTKYPSARYNLLFKYFLGNGLNELQRHIVEFKPNVGGK